jgi:sigma-E factor negative regulatory protein RseC
MIEEPARVVTCEAGFALVETQIQAACGSCQAEGSCGTSVISGLFKRRRNVLQVLNPIQAKPGEQVIIGLQERALVTVSLLAYLMPLVCLILLAVAAQEVAQYGYGGSGELAGIAGGLLGLIIGLALLKWFSLRNRNDPAFQAVILRQASAKPVHFL